jgi:hypothetical protein
MDNLYELIRSQPVTNRLYEMNKLTEEIQKSKPIALENTEDTEIGNNAKDEASYAIKLTREAKQLPEIRKRLNPSEVGEKFRDPRQTESTSE